MSTELITVKQLPIIEEQLLAVKSGVQKRVSAALSLAVTEDTVKSVKAARAALNKEFAELESRRKEVKAVVLEPYNKFEAIYKECVSDLYRDADGQLKARIAEVEDAIKAERRAGAESYFAEYAQSKGIDFVTFEQAGIAITLSASWKSQQDQIRANLDRISEDLALIDTQEHKAEILVEYKKSLNVSRAVTTVSARMKAIAAERERVAQAEARAALQQNPAEAPATPHTPEPLGAPAEIRTSEDVATVYSIQIVAHPHELVTLEKYLISAKIQYKVEVLKCQ